MSPEILDPQGKKAEPAIDPVQLIEYVDRSTGKHVTVARSVNLFNDPNWKPQPDIVSGSVGVMTQHGPMPFNFEFPLGMKLKECFEKFEEVAKKSVEEKQQENQKRIHVPGKDF